MLMQTAWTNHILTFLLSEYKPVLYFLFYFILVCTGKKTINHTIAFKMTFFLLKRDTPARNSLYARPVKFLFIDSWMGETAKGLLIANYHFTTIIHYVLAITIINQLCKQLGMRRRRAGCGNACNLNFNILSGCFVKWNSKLVSWHLHWAVWPEEFTG